MCIGRRGRENGELSVGPAKVPIHISRIAAALSLRACVPVPAYPRPVITRSLADTESTFEYHVYVVSFTCFWVAHRFDLVVHLVLPCLEECMIPQTNSWPGVYALRYQTLKVRYHYNRSAYICTVQYRTGSPLLHAILPVSFFTRHRQSSSIRGFDSFPVQTYAGGS